CCGLPQGWAAPRPGAANRAYHASRSISRPPDEEALSRHDARDNARAGGRGGAFGAAELSRKRLFGIPPDERRGRVPRNDYVARKSAARELARGRRKRVSCSRLILGVRAPARCIGLARRHN